LMLKKITSKASNSLTKGCQTGKILF